MADNKIIPDAVIRADNYIDQADADATPANDEGRVPKLEANGFLHPYFSKIGFVPNAGATIAGATTPVPVMQNKTDNEVYSCDADDTALLKFIGFAISSSTDGNPIAVQTSGIVGGFSGLSEGEKYYVQDAVGTIGTTVGTNEVLVGIAISETELLIQKGRRVASGVLTLNSTVDTTLTVGFRPTKVNIHAVRAGSARIGESHGGWTVMGGNKCVYFGAKTSSTESEDSGVSTTKAWNIVSENGTVQQSGVIGNITDTSFDLENVEANASEIYLYWEAEGEI